MLTHKLLENFAKRLTPRRVAVAVAVEVAVAVNVAVVRHMNRDELWT